MALVFVATRARPLPAAQRIRTALRRLDWSSRRDQDQRMVRANIEWIAERGGYRAGVEPRPDGLFQVHLERWVPGGIPEEPALWSRVRTRAVISDSAPNARALAIEELNAVAPPEG